MTDETTATEPKPRKARSDKGKRRERAFMVTVDVDGGAEACSEMLRILGTGTTAQGAMDMAAKGLTYGQTCHVWQRVGKPRMAQMRLI